ncbi:hypothetical protein [Amycolatopsis nigrescens]|uniref:hypothetical protein n=1 Tax=Amycolatopsis nigrescens TaxID=381445 RepID=UPI0003630C8B|nr:hypothetical protein [Amycolatopsis nigrescens]
MNTSPSSEPSPVEWDGIAWWTGHDRANGNRPKYGSRVRIREGDRYAGYLGTVTWYEGQWNSTTFPVQLDGTGLTLLCSTADVVEI